MHHISIISDWYNIAFTGMKLKSFLFGDRSEIAPETPAMKRGITGSEALPKSGSNDLSA
jgi:hypothetical protein